MTANPLRRAPRGVPAPLLPLLLLLLLLLLLASCGDTPGAYDPAAPHPELAAFRERLAELDRALGESRKSVDALAARVAAAEAEAARLGRDLAAAREEIASLRMPGTPGGGPAPAVKGTVLAADGEMDIYIVSAGEKEGVEVGNELTVYRGDSFVAVVVVEKVFRDKSSVRVKRVEGKPFQKSEIRQGDRVATIE